jgi:hypothetical protein
LRASTSEHTPLRIPAVNVDDKQDIEACIAHELEHEVCLKGIVWRIRNVVIICLACIFDRRVDLHGGLLTDWPPVALMRLRVCVRVMGMDWPAVPT